MKHLAFIKKFVLPFGIIILCAFAFAPPGYAGFFDNYAKFKRIPEMRNRYVDKETLPDYNYYYTGRSNLPYAVIGVDPGYEINSRFWNKIETKDMVTEKVGELMPVHPYDMNTARILDKDGKQIGIWFSYYPGTVVKLGQGRSLIVYSPYKPTRWAN